MGRLRCCAVASLSSFGWQAEPMSYVVAAELVANVGAVLVQVGDAVGPLDTLVILESMKMEIPVLAEVSGVVCEVAVTAGEAIREGDTIAVIDTAGSQ
jgi:acetyl-CoA carboxylase biotin carboxyl carrier protein